MIIFNVDWYNNSTVFLYSPLGANTSFLWPLETTIKLFMVNEILCQIVRILKGEDDDYVIVEDKDFVTA